MAAFAPNTPKADHLRSAKFCRNAGRFKCARSGSWLRAATRTFSPSSRRALLDRDQRPLVLVGDLRNPRRL